MEMDMPIELKLLELIDKVGSIFVMRDGIGNDDKTLRLNDSLEFLNRESYIRKMMKGVTGYHSPKGGILEWQSETLINTKIKITQPTLALDTLIDLDRMGGNIQACHCESWETSG
jgi:hypothetical protein